MNACHSRPAHESDGRPQPACDDVAPRPERLFLTSSSPPVKSSLGHSAGTAAPSAPLAQCRLDRLSEPSAVDCPSPVVLAPRLLVHTAPATMLTKSSSHAAHLGQNAALLALSLLFLPLDTFILALCYALRRFLTAGAPASAAPTASAGARKTILVTGVGMSKALTLARLFALAGHRVVGADFDGHVCGRASRAVGRFHTLARPGAGRGAAPYVESVLDVVARERVDLWVSCSGVASAVEDGEAKEAVEARTACRAVQFGVRDTQTLHEKHSFIARARELGLPVPETHEVASREEALRILEAHREGGGRPSKQFIMKSVGVDDASRADMTLLPRPSAAETRAHVGRLNVSPANPFILQEFIRGPEFCTHALVVRGEVRAFVACPSAELLMHYEALPPGGPLAAAMLAFTRRFAAAGGDAFTGHLSFDFLVRDEDARRAATAADVTLYPIECNPRAHTAVVLFNDSPALVPAYLELLRPRKRTGLAAGERADPADPVVPRRPARYYWTGHDLATLVALPLLRLVAPGGGGSVGEVAQGARTFLARLLSWRDGTFEAWDPLPWWWLYHVYWPVQFARSIATGKRWSRINVSTTKMFGVE